MDIFEKIDNSPGFTLIETLVYLALFGIFIGGAVLAAYNMIESSARNRVEIMVQEEGNFLVEKFEWALSDAQNITSPLAGTSGPTLVEVNFDASSMALSLVGNNMQIQDAQGSYALNNSSVKVSCPNLTGCFSYQDSSGSGDSPQSAQITFMLTASDAAGLPVSQNFSAIKYLRK